MAKGFSALKVRKIFAESKKTTQKNNLFRVARC